MTHALALAALVLLYILVALCVWIEGRYSN